MKKKLLWIIDSLGPGGAEHLMPTILDNIDKTKFEQRVCVLQIKQGNPVGKELEEMGVSVDLVNIPNLRHPKNLPKILSYLRQYRPDIIHTQLEFADTLGNLAAKILGIPSVATLHTLDAPLKQERTYWRHQMMWMSLRYCANLVISVSESARKHHIREGRLPPSKVITLYNGIDLSPFAPEEYPNPRNMRAKFNIPAEGNLIITIAVLREPKGIQYMLAALPQILATIPNTHYLIVGDGNHMQSLQEHARLLKVEKHVHFAGYQTDIPPLLAMSDLFVLPTLDDALPTVLIEAMAAQKPIVASSVGGVPELLEDGVSGTLVPPAKKKELAMACLHLIKNKEEAAAMAQSGRDIAQKKFSIHIQVKKLENLYMEFIENYEK